MLIASSVNGFLFGFVSGQPLLILGPTGPFLVFEEMVYDVSVHHGVSDNQ
jgi:MFS superfamily sulfate permease-like transporter